MFNLTSKLCKRGKNIQKYSVSTSIDGFNALFQFAILVCVLAAVLSAQAYYQGAGSYFYPGAQLGGALPGGRNDVGKCLNYLFNYFVCNLHTMVICLNFFNLILEKLLRA